MTLQARDGKILLADGKPTTKENCCCCNYAIDVFSGGVDTKQTIDLRWSDGSAFQDFGGEPGGGSLNVEPLHAADTYHAVVKYELMNPTDPWEDISCMYTVFNLSGTECLTVIDGKSGAKTFVEPYESISYIIKSTSKGEIAFSFEVKCDCEVTPAE
jgi:hypothetical protein